MMLVFRLHGDYYYISTAAFTSVGAFGGCITFAVVRSRWIGAR
jgi:hypothetical protein